MLRIGLISALVFVSLSLSATEREFDFSKVKPNEAPPGFRNTVSGQGKPGDWKIVMDALPPAFAPLTPGAPNYAKQPVLAQLSTDKTDEHFPMLVVDSENFADFTFTTRFKTVSGEVEQMAGIAFRIQDERNYYYVRASSKGSTFRFFKFLNGERTENQGVDIAIPSGVWHELTVICKANTINCLLNGKQVMPTITDNSPFGPGKVAFWTKSDSVSYFANPRLSYTPLEYPVQTVLKSILERYPRLIGLKIFAPLPGKKEVTMIASNDPAEIGTAAQAAELDVYNKGVIYHGNTKSSVTVTVPIRDRNGETMAAMRVVMPTFPGQTEQNAITRAIPYTKMFEERLKSPKDLVE